LCTKHNLSKDVDDSQYSDNPVLCHYLAIIFLHHTSPAIL